MRRTYLIKYTSIISLFKFKFKFKFKQKYVLFRLNKSITSIFIKFLK
jgi:hypothetical protein